MFFLQIFRSSRQLRKMKQGRQNYYAVVNCLNFVSSTLNLFAQDKDAKYQELSSEHSYLLTLFTFT
jgi:hypothetical protein